MKRENLIWNPYLPDFEYVPDGEPHVFGDRIYIYGSHDRFNGKKFCMNDYICYSAPVTDLTDWRYEGVIYSPSRDPRLEDGVYQLWAPDVVQGKDGRYYLYYCPDDRIRTIGVAVCDEPAGSYEFLGIVQDAVERYIGERDGDTIQFDPGVFRDEDGTVYLYSGNGPRTRSAIGKEPKASVVMTLEDDMITIKTEPKKLLPVLGEAEGTGFEGHEFFEASSIRKIGGLYYLVYSSVTLHELCYAVSDRPDEGFRYGGVVVSNADSFPVPGTVSEDTEDNALSGRLRREGRPPFTKEFKNCYGNDHGGIECVNGEWYVFYHRQTNRTMFSRQGCAEKLHMQADGSIPQAELTSQGLYGKPLPGSGVYPASMVCELYGKARPQISFSLAMGMRYPFLTQDGPDTDPDRNERKPWQYIANMQKGDTAVFRYFDIKGADRVSVRVRGRANGIIKVYTEEENEPVGEIRIFPAKEWTSYTAEMKLPEGVHELRLCYEGRGRMDLLAFKIG